MRAEGSLMRARGHLTRATGLLAVLVITACSGAAPETAAISYGLGRPASDSAIAAMDTDISLDGDELPAGRGTVAQGATLYAAQCASCHGKDGEGMGSSLPALNGRSAATDSFDFARDPALVKTVTNYWPHATTLFDYIKRAMPLTSPGSLSDDEVYALTAYILAKDRVVADTVTMDAAALRAVRMPARDRFVADDRSPTKP